MGWSSRRALRPPLLHPAVQLGCCSLVDATATGGTVECGAAGLVLTVSPAQFAPIAAGVTVTGKAGYTAAVNPAALLGQTCSSRYGAATWGSAGGATTLAVAATDTACTTGTDGSCSGLVTRLTPRGKLAVGGRHTCTIRAADGAVLCSGTNYVCWQGGRVGGLGSGFRVPASAPPWQASCPSCCACDPALPSPSPPPVPPSSLGRPTNPLQQVGELGIDPATTRTSPTLMAAAAPAPAGSGILGGATWVAAASALTIGPLGHTCACLASGGAVCFGGNAAGQVRDGRSATLRVPGPPRVARSTLAGVLRDASRPRCPKPRPRLRRPPPPPIRLAARRCPGPARHFLPARSRRHRRSRHHPPGRLPSRGCHPRANALPDKCWRHLRRRLQHL